MKLTLMLNHLFSHNPFRWLLNFFESDDDLSLYAVRPQQDEKNIVDQIVFDSFINAADVILRWNRSGDRAGIIVNERLSLVFDFKQQIAYSDQLVPTV